MDQMELQLRAMAMDLATKAYTEGDIIALAKSILDFLKGEQTNG